MTTNRGRWLSTAHRPDGNGACVVYCMSRDQRVQGNHALLVAQDAARQLHLPLAVAFCLSPNPKGRAREHVLWMLEGLKEVEQELQALNIPFILLIGDHSQRFAAFAKTVKPALLATDFNPLQGSMRWQTKLAQSYPVLQIDTHNIVPAWQVSQKQEVGARTIRRKIHDLLPEYLVEPLSVTHHTVAWPGRVISIDGLANEIAAAVVHYPANGTHITWQSGPAAARAHVRDYVIPHLPNYSELRNDPTKDGLTNLSPYLHFGHISSLQIVLLAEEAAAAQTSLRPGLDVLIEEMVVRKELADNYCLYNHHYRSLAGVPAWAQATLQSHVNDPRPYLYSYNEFQSACTHDPAWNAAQQQLRKTGKIHGYMRMYWAKKVLEWSDSPDIALQTLIRLNDFYSIDGGDPNGYVGILWSVGGLHDRPWGNRPIYGTVRSMVYAGLKRKFDISQYEKKWL